MASISSVVTPRQGKPLVSQAGGGAYSLAIPSSQVWLGTSLVMQGFRVDTVAGAISFVPQNALELVLGY